jgi:glycerate kinase
MTGLLAVVDKFRGTASAAELNAAAVGVADALGYRARALTIADGGEGLLEVVGGESRVEVVSGPLGAPVRAEWRLRQTIGSIDEPVGVVEMAKAAGLVLVGGAAHNRPLLASTTGVGELVVAAIRAGARRVIVGCGGSASTDGGLGAIEAIGDAHRAAAVRLTVACDVTTLFCDNARVFGPQKGATPDEIEILDARLARLRQLYLDRFGVDVGPLVGGGASGGLAGGLAAIGGELVSGFGLVAELVGLDRELDRADVVVTGEGRLDPTSLVGKVVGELARRCAGHTPLICIAGSVDPALGPDPLPGATVVSLEERFGLAAAMADPVACFATAAGEVLRRLRPRRVGPRWLGPAAQ